MNADVAVLVADNREIVRDGLASLLDAAPGIQVLDTAADGSRRSIGRGGCASWVRRWTWC